MDFPTKSKVEPELDPNPPTSGNSEETSPLTLHLGLVHHTSGPHSC